MNGIFAVHFIILPTEGLYIVVLLPIVFLLRNDDFEIESKAFSVTNQNDLYIFFFKSFFMRNLGGSLIFKAGIP